MNVKSSADVNENQIVSYNIGFKIDSMFVFAFVNIWFITHNASIETKINA